MAVPNTHEGPARIGAVMDGVRSRGGSVYCIGIGGVMMASLAILTARAGFPVSGSDRAFAGGCNSPTAQRLTAEYLDNLPLTKNSRLYVGGHSKGGNLAVWGAGHASPATRDRIVRVYSNDGPGFSEKMLESEAYRTLADRIDSLVPQSSLVGMLLSHDECDVIRSSQLGIFQHNGLSWEVMGGSFVRAHRLSGRGVRNDSVIRARIDSMTMEERKKFTELFFGILESTGARTLTELNAGSIRNVIIMLRTVSDMDRETKEMALYLIGKLFDIRPLTVPRKQKKRGAVRFEFGLTVGRRKSAPMQEQKP